MLLSDTLEDTIKVSPTGTKSERQKPPSSPFSPGNTNATKMLKISWDAQTHVASHMIISHETCACMMWEFELMTSNFVHSSLPFHLHSTSN